MKTYYQPKPIPIRAYDWEAICDDYEPGDPIGFGETEFDAVRDLERQNGEQRGRL